MPKIFTLTVLIIEEFGFFKSVVHLKDAYGMANSVQNSR